MTWLIVIALAALAFGAAVFLFKLKKALWSSLLAALAVGLAGYSLQASPGLPSAPKAAGANRAAPLFDVVEVRRDLLASDERSRADFIVTADALAREGRYQQAAQLLASVTRDNPQDFEAWIAEGNALVEHADGVLTVPALYAYRQAAELKPQHLAPNYFLGVALIRQGRFLEARQVWADSLAAAPEGAVGREIVGQQLERLDAMLAAVSQMEDAPAPPPPAAPEPSGQ
ncbi:tetratricopeptide repeat protein [Aurantiacibacter suaedae]|uniref:tetratricopeptide repeat protein n=1 Tax=Aurantiacibacter suaedae TaxID=2545755 RepID=UPI0010F477FB|nr:cytochrome C biosynthesis protein [Aurantiacibacter suaedae]